MTRSIFVCMGTTFRSLLSWEINTTAVELVPSVPRLFWYFHSNAPEVVKLPQAHIVIDDGRRYLERTTQQFDLITIVLPPPPVEAAGSSMLYSEEFYAAARKRLRPGGILAQWIPDGDAKYFAAVARSLHNSFPYVRVFRWGTRWGFHFLCSEQPLPNLTARNYRTSCRQTPRLILRSGRRRGAAARRCSARSRACCRVKCRSKR